MRAIAFGFALFVSGCLPSDTPLPPPFGSDLALPFGAIKAANSQTTAYLLQDYEPPRNGSRDFPRQIEQYAQRAGGLLPPLVFQRLGLGGQSAEPTPPDAPKFHDFRILGSAFVSDPANRDAIFDLFGHASNFQAPKEECMFAELGFTLAVAPNPVAQPADVLASLSCNNVKAFGFTWPYGNNTAFTPDGWKKIHGLVAKLFGEG